MQYPGTFAELLAPHEARTLFLGDDGQAWRYGDALAWSRQPDFTATRRQLVLCLLDNDPGTLLGYLALMAAGAVPLVIGPGWSDERLAALVAAYRPAWAWVPLDQARVLGAAAGTVNHGQQVLVPLASPDGAPTASLHPDLALLLSTSGSTGSPRFVRLSLANVLSNAQAIASYLQLSPDERPITSLPPHYTYGLSVLHSHLVVGATVVVTPRTFFDRSFWALMRSAGVTSLAGVPYHYDMLQKLRFWKQDLPALRTLTQAGGRMDPQAARAWAEAAAERGVRYVTMYGQVEATARMAYLPPELAVGHAGSIGQAIPGGRFWLEDEAGQVVDGPDVTGQLVYAGPNVAMGYADGVADLARGDDFGGVLRTGDLARRDAQGLYSIVGRLKRFLKLFGNRVNLEDVEHTLQRQGLDAACSGRDDLLTVYLTGGRAETAASVKAQVAALLKVHPSAVQVMGLPALPRSASGKLLYAELATTSGEALA